MEWGFMSSYCMFLFNCGQGVERGTGRDVPLLVLFSPLGHWLVLVLRKTSKVQPGLADLQTRTTKSRLFHTVNVAKYP